jgi:N-acetylneuraminic acid mutarotase
MRGKSESAFGVCAVACLITTATVIAFLRSEATTMVSQRALTFAERVAYQRAIEGVYWRHRIWPNENLNPKPSLDAVMSQAQLEKKVTDYLRNSQALADYYHYSVTAEDLQAEMDRMAENTKQPERLRELFQALGNDPFLIAECLARPMLSERLITSFAQEQREDYLASWEVGANVRRQKMIRANAGYTLPAISEATTECSPNTWTATSITNAPVQRRFHTAVWTGSEMIVWGGLSNGASLYSGRRYNPSTDSWTNTSTNYPVPAGRSSHTAVWTGSEMIVWGGEASTGGVFNSGGRYNPSIDTWAATSTTNAPEGREEHAAVWTGSEMIVWGGSGISALNTGGRYNPSTDTWIATSTANVPEAREEQTAVWTDNEMIVWGGDGTNGFLNNGGRYNPSTDTWRATSIADAPDARAGQTAVWTGSEMIVWGGSGISDFNTGGRYDPNTDSWTATSTANAPEAREEHTAVWTGIEMIVWGGEVGTFSPTDTGGRYNPDSDTWISTSTTDVPTAREEHTAVWTGGEMIIWGGKDSGGNVNTGGRYCSRYTPTSRPRPTPAPRP